MHKFIAPSHFFKKLKLIELNENRIGNDDFKAPERRRSQSRLRKKRQLIVSITNRKETFKSVLSSHNCNIDSAPTLL